MCNKAARELQTIFNSPKEFNKWRAKLESDANLKKGWAKVVEYITDLIENIKNFVKQIGMTAEEKAKANELIAKLELYADAYKATMKAVEQRSQEKNSQKDGEVKLNKGYNDKTSHSLKKQTAKKGRTTEIEIMENNRFERLRKYRDDLPSEWYAYTSNYFYIYSNNSYTDYTILAKVSITNTNRQDILKFTEGLKSGIDGSTKAFDEWTTHFRRGKGRYSWHSVNSEKTRATRYANGMDVQSSTSDNFRDLEGSGKHSQLKTPFDIQEASSNGRGIKKSLSLKAKYTDKTNNPLANIEEIEKKNKKTSYSKKKSFRPEYDWHTGLTKAQVLMVEERVNKAGKNEARSITDTAFWYRGRLEGQDLFVIYSMEDPSGATILYLQKGANATEELNILMDLLEDEENGESFVEKSRIVDEVLTGDWMQEKYDVANNYVRLGETRGNTGYASILQGESSEFIGSSAFREVIGNLYDIQEASSNGRGIKKSLSLKAKNTDKTNNPLANIEEIEKKKREVMSRFGLTIYEADAVVKYKTAESYKINAKLRNDETQLTEYQKEIVKLLDSALEKLPKHKGKTFRTVSFDDMFNPEEEYNTFLEQHVAGSIVRYGAYTSTSSKIDGHPMPEDTKFGITLEIEGENGRDVEGFGNNFEKEVVYPRGLYFVVTEVRTDSKGKPYIKVKEIQKNGRLETSSEEHSNILQQVQTEGELHGNLHEVSERNTRQGVDTENAVQRVRTDNEGVKVGETKKTAEISHSLKGGVEVSSQKTTEFLDTVEDVQHGKKGAAERLYKYVENVRLKT